jgi:uncharacterized protein (DUF2132 family)
MTGSGAYLNSFVCEQPLVFLFDRLASRVRERCCNCAPRLGTCVRLRSRKEWGRNKVSERVRSAHDARRKLTWITWILPTKEFVQLARRSLELR